MKRIYCRLALLMAEKDPQLSQRQLAEETELDNATVHRLFANKFARVDTKTIEALCDYFQKGIGDLFELREAEDIPLRALQNRQKRQSRK